MNDDFEFSFLVTLVLVGHAVLNLDDSWIAQMNSVSVMNQDISSNIGIGRGGI